MAIPRIYLETTMFNFYYANDSKPGYKDLKAQVRRIFDCIQAGEFEPYTSAYTTKEIEAETNLEKREKMKRLIMEYGIKTLEVTDEVKQLASLYIQEKAIPAAYTTDAAHIAITVVNGLDFIVSLNFEHIARLWTVERVQQVNTREGYKDIGIYKPMEVLEL